MLHLTPVNQLTRRRQGGVEGNEGMTQRILRRGSGCVAGAIVWLLLAAPAAAQVSEWPWRGFVAINGGFQPSTSDFSDNVVFSDAGGVYTETLSGAAAQEQARFAGAYRVASGTLFDVSGGARVWRNLGVGVGMSRSALDGATSISAQVPHPFFFRRDRSIASGTDLPFTREESAVHVQLLAVLPVRRAFSVTVFGGPTFFNVKQDLVADVRFTHSYPYDTAAFSEAITVTAQQSKVGFNVGADVAYYFSNNVGVGWLTRYSGATIELPSANDGTARITAGGLHTAGGLRLRF